MEIEVVTEAVDRDDDPVSVAAITLLDRWRGIARNSAFRRRYEAVCELGKAR